MYKIILSCGPNKHFTSFFRLNLLNLPLILMETYISKFFLDIDEITIEI